LGAEGTPPANLLDAVAKFVASDRTRVNVSRAGIISDVPRYMLFHPLLAHGRNCT
jgi:hypothetical protein